MDPCWDILVNKSPKWQIPWFKNAVFHLILLPCVSLHFTQWTGTVLSNQNDKCIRINWDELGVNTKITWQNFATILCLSDYLNILLLLKRFFSILIQGFGEPSGEHWLGNDIIHKLTSSQEYSLHVQLKDREGNEAFSHYDRFYIDGEHHNYRLTERRAVRFKFRSECVSFNLSCNDFVFRSKSSIWIMMNEFWDVAKCELT